MLLDQLPDDSAFKTESERGGRWVDWKQMLADLVNENYRQRADFRAFHGGEEFAYDTTPFEVLDPIDRAERDRLAAEEAERSKRSLSEFNEALGL